MDLLPGFARKRIRTLSATIQTARAGHGEPLLLLHGYPQTMMCWHRIAPALSEHYTVVLADLRGYGDSSKPKGLPDHSNYSKRAMAQDMVEVMRAHGFERFHLVTHDRGARVGHRLARDHGTRVRSLTVMDISPTLKVFESADQKLASAYWHWFHMLQPAPLPERMLQGVAPYHVLGRVGNVKPDLKAFHKAALAEYERVYADPKTIHAGCEDYRAAATIDLAHDRADRGRKIAMPVLALWGAKAVVGTMFNCLADWREVASDVEGRAIDCGHFLPEEAPADVLAELQRFLAKHPIDASAKARAVRKAAAPVTPPTRTRRPRAIRAGRAA